MYSNLILHSCEEFFFFFFCLSKQEKLEIIETKAMENFKKDRGSTLSG